MSRLMRWSTVLGASLAVLLALPVFGLAISDYGNTALARLWRATPEGDRFTCTGFYAFPVVEGASNSGYPRSLLLTAGHCAKANANLVKTPRVHQSGGMSAVVNWVWIVQGPWFQHTTIADYAIGIVPDVRDAPDIRKLFLGTASPEPGAKVYIHGFPNGVERVTAGQVAPVAILEERLKEKLPAGTYVVVVPENMVRSGSSGGPVFDGNGNVVGILWGLVTPGGIFDDPNFDFVLVTPIEPVIEALKTLGFVPRP